MAECDIIPVVPVAMHLTGMGQAPGLYLPGERHVGSQKWWQMLAEKNVSIGGLLQKGTHPCYSLPGKQAKFQLHHDVVHGMFRGLEHKQESALGNKPAKLTASAIVLLW